jgi:DNA-directed RNA polymerase subunit H (RpoH/RPB5)
MDRTMDRTISDILIRSRQTLLEILEDRGYDTTTYRNISPDQILTLATGHPRALDVIVPKREGSPAPCDRAVVTYMIQDRIKGRLGTIVRDIYEESSNEAVVATISRKDDVIIIMNEPAHDAFDKASLQLWQTQKARMTFFHIKQVVVHLGRHVLVPPHRKLSDEEAKAEIERLHITQRAQLPLIKYHDIQSRLMGLVPGDLVEIIRPSPTAGVMRYIRLCAA